MFLMRKKAWRRLKNRKRERRFRYLLFGILILETAFFLREADFVRLVEMTDAQQIPVEPKSGDEAEKDTETMPGEIVYGIQFRPETGSLDLYRKETRIRKKEKGLVTEK